MSDILDMFDDRGVAVAFALIAVLAAWVIWRSLKKMNRSDAEFDLRDLLMENGRASKAACVMMGAFAVTTWQFVYFSLIGKMTEGYAAIYVGAWIAPVVARLIAKGENAAHGQQKVTTTTETTVKG